MKAIDELARGAAGAVLGHEVGEAPGVAGA